LLLPFANKVENVDIDRRQLSFVFPSQSMTLKSVPSRVHLLPTEFLAFWHCLHSVRSRVYETVRCPSVRPSVQAWAHCSKLAAAGLLLWARRAEDIDRLLQRRHAADECRQIRLIISTVTVYHVVSVRRWLSTDLL